jgi:hypothetical protein
LTLSSLVLTPRVCHLPVGSYFALQWLANLLVLASSLGNNCNASGSAGAVAKLVNLLASFSLSIIATNLLCHRHLCEKARIMIKLYGPTCNVFRARCPPPPPLPLSHPM